MTQEQLIELKEVIIKANPEIKELKFGCRIENVKVYSDITTRMEGYPDGIIIKDLRDPDHLYLSVDSGDQQEYLIRADEKCEFEIIGRDIRLADVLLAMNADKENIWGYYLDLNGKLVEEYEYEFGMELNPTNFQWNLKDDNLDNQSEETKEFLYELLVNKKV